MPTWQPSLTILERATSTRQTACGIGCALAFYRYQNIPTYTPSATASRSLREIVAHPNYIVLYRVAAERIEIVTIVHARQQYPR